MKFFEGASEGNALYKATSASETLRKTGQWLPQAKDMKLTVKLHRTLNTETEEN